MASHEYRVVGRQRVRQLGRRWSIGQVGRFEDVEDPSNVAVGRIKKLIDGAHHLMAVVIEADTNRKRLIRLC